LKLVQNKNLTAGEIEGAMREILEKGASAGQIVSLITALMTEDVTPEEITAVAKAIREKITGTNGGEDIVYPTRKEVTVEREIILRAAYSTLWIL
jgi:anthranilate phosphoribosyltransferase